VYGWERLVLFRHLLDQGLSKAAIARQLEVSRRTVYHWITTGQLERDLTGPLPRVRVGRRRSWRPTTRSFHPPRDLPGAQCGAAL
jgi:transposase